TSASSVGAATHCACPDLRRRCGECRDRRTRAVWPTFHHPLCAKLGKFRAGPDCSGGGFAPWTGVTGETQEKNETQAMPVIDLANPTRFLAVVNRVLPWLIAATAILFAVGLFRAMNAPD